MEKKRFKKMVKTIGQFVPAPRLGGKAHKNKRDATLVDETIRFHGTRLTVQVHHAYPSRLLSSKISIASGREVILRDKNVEVYIDDHLINVCFLKRRKTGRTRRPLRRHPIYGAFPHELPKRMLSKFPVIFSYDSAGCLEGIEIFKPKSTSPQ